MGRKYTAIELDQVRACFARDVIFNALQGNPALLQQPTQLVENAFNAANIYIEHATKNGIQISAPDDSGDDPIANAIESLLDRLSGGGDEDKQTHTEDINAKNLKDMLGMGEGDDQ